MGKSSKEKTGIPGGQLPAKSSAVLKGYQQILQDVQAILGRAVHLAHKAVDQVRLNAYWEVGERMVRGELENKDRADYGSHLVANMAKDLGISRYELARMSTVF